MRRALGTAVLAASMCFSISAANLELSTGWQIQSSALVPQGGATVSTASYSPSGWYDAVVPTTVMAALVEAGVYPDIFLADNINRVNSAAFDVPWWYRTSFSLPARSAEAHVRLRFEGINHRAEIWLNGTLIAPNTEVVGCFRSFSFDITGLLNGTGSNTLALRISRPDPELDLSLNYVDWAPRAPDGNMGIYRSVTIETSGPVIVENPQISTVLSLPSLATAAVTVYGDVENLSGVSVTTTVSGSLGSVSFSSDITLAAHERREVTFGPGSYPQLSIASPQVWWPWQYGAQPLYALNLTASIAGIVSDSASAKVGIRQVSARIVGESKVFSVNGKDIFIKGGGWAPDLLQRFSDRGYEDHIRYARDLNLNTIRLEGKFEDQHFYDLCDSVGMLIFAGWCCCDSWEKWEDWRPEDYTVAYGSQHDILTGLRSHPSMLVWGNGSDYPPPATVQNRYNAIADSLHWPAPTIANVSDSVAPGTAGPSGFKMRGPYDWVPPIYWYSDTERGGAFGFSAEIGPGPSIPPEPSLRRMMDKAPSWPADTLWRLHCGGNDFNNTDIADGAQNARYGSSRSATEFATKAQMAAYEAHRAMFEAYTKNKYTGTGGVVQWMLNNAWPSLIWHLYDWYLRPGGSYYGVKNACEALHVQYSYDTRSVDVVNASNIAANGLSAHAELWDIDGTRVWQSQTSCSVPADGVDANLIAIPEPAGLSTTRILRLALRGPAGDTQSLASYWLSAQDDVPDWEGDNPWYTTLLSSYADLSQLCALDTISLSATALRRSESGEVVISTQIVNASNTIAFGVHAAVNEGAGTDEILPVRWSDNYLVLLPGETRTLSARFLGADMAGRSPQVTVDGWNVRPLLVDPDAVALRGPAFNAAAPAACRICIYDLKGRTLVDRVLPRIPSSAELNRQFGDGLAAGSYLVAIRPLRGAVQFPATIQQLFRP